MTLMRTGVVACSIVLATMVVSPHAQRAPAQRVAFDVASVKPNVARDGERDGNLAGTRFWMKYATLADFVHFAFLRPNGNVRNDAEFAGGPSWMNSDHFDLVATLSGMPAGLDAANTAAGAVTSAELSAIDRVRLMMQTLLADRFRMVTHHEMRELPVYELTLARSDKTAGKGLRKVDVNCAELRQRRLADPSLAADDAPCGGFRRSAPGHFEGHGVPMDLIVDLFEGIVGRNVVDRTGLAGVFDLQLEFTPDQPARAPEGALPLEPGAPSIFTAVREQLGLRLESTRAPVDVLVIDSAQKPLPD